MADPVISLLLERLADIIEKKVTEEINLIRGVKKEVRNLSTVLKTIQSVLNDAEKRIVEDETVKTWLELLQDVVYDADDVFDELKTADIKKQIGGGEDDPALLGNKKKKVSCSFLSTFCCFRKVTTRRGIALKIKELNERLDFIAQQKSKYNFLRGEVDELRDFKPMETNSIIDESEIYGRDSAKESLVSKLLYDNDEEQIAFRVISVVGCGGIGKTTLAKLAYNDNEVINSFDYRIWVCVSDPFNIIHVAKAIVESIRNESPNLSRLDPLLNMVQDLLSQKRFLLVLDDVWTENPTKWEPLKTCLRRGAPGSKVLVTTRNEGVAKIMGATHIHHLGTLSEHECWTLVRNIAFSVPREPNHAFEAIGRQIARRCNGLPLAAKAMGSLLLLKNTLGEWKSVLGSRIWNLNNVESEVFPLLHLSYNDLPIPLRRCFSYCAIFPKDYEIGANGLIHMWIAQGYVSSSGEGDKLHQRGQEYLEELARRSFFQELNRDEFDGRILSCKMHDIVHDFAQYLRRNECLMLEEAESIIEEAMVSSSQTAYRHLSWLSSSESTISPVITGFDKLRTFFAPIYYKEELLEDIIRHMKYVRVFSLPDGYFTRLPDDIGKLIHLRYLDLSGNKGLSRLPEMLCDLCNLETLNLGDMYRLQELPDGMGKLTNLRHLLIQNTDTLKQLPEGLKKLTGLETLDVFRAGEGYNKLGFLNSFNQIEGFLTIHFIGLMNDSDVLEAERAELSNKTNLHYLELTFNWKIRRNVVKNVVEDLIESLQPPPNLERLKIKMYWGQTLPKWITTSLNHLRELVIEHGKNLLSLPPLWKLQFLEILNIQETENITHITLEFFGQQPSSSSSSSSLLPVIAFPKLKKLFFVDCVMEEWEDMTDEEENVASVMPCLQELSLIYCKKLKALPHRLLSRITTLKKLDIEGSTHLVERYGAEEDRAKLPWLARVQVPT